MEDLRGNEVVAVSGEATGVQMKAKEPGQQKQEMAGQRKKTKPKTGQSGYYEIAPVMSDREMALGTRPLFDWLSRQWQRLNSAVYYITVYAPENIRRNQTVRAAQRGLIEYVDAKAKEVDDLLAKYQQMAEDEGVKLGHHTNSYSIVLGVSSNLGSRLIRLFRAVDLAGLIVETLWISEIITREERDEALGIARSTYTSIHSLVTKMRSRLVEFRRAEREKSEKLLAEELAFVEMMRELTNYDMRPLLSSPSEQGTKEQATDEPVLTGEHGEVGVMEKAAS